MIYQVRANLFFDTQDPIDDIKDKILDHWPDTIVINRNQPNQECSVIDIIENHHDESPPNPCVPLFHQQNALEQ